MGRQSLTRPIEELADVMRRFMRSVALRLLWVESDMRLRAAAVETITGFEHHADNKSPMLHVQLERVTDDDEGWEAAVGVLRDAYEGHRSAGAPLEAMQAKPLGDHGAANFSVQLLQFVSSVQAPATGLIVVLDVGMEDPPDLWLRRIEDMVRSDELKDVRFILLSSPRDKAKPWTETFEKGTTAHYKAEVHEGEAIRELELELDTEEQLGPGMRGAWPKGVPVPPRPRRWRPPGATRAPTNTRPPTAPPTDGPTPPPMVDAEGENAEAPDLRLLVQRAALAMRKKDGPETVRNQTAARDLCLHNGEIRDAITMELMLGGYLLQLEQQGLAAESFGRAGKQAHEADYQDLAAEAFLAQAAAAEDAQDDVKALEAYRHAIESAQAAPRPALAIRAYWRAGQVALRLKLEIECIGLWADAVVYTDKLPEDERKIPYAKEIAKRLSELLAKHRRYQEAREIERMATAF